MLTIRELLVAAPILLLIVVYCAYRALGGRSLRSVVWNWRRQRVK